MAEAAAAVGVMVVLGGAGWCWVVVGGGGWWVVVGGGGWWWVVVSGGGWWWVVVGGGGWWWAMVGGEQREGVFLDGKYKPFRVVELRRTVELRFIVESSVKRC